MLCLGDNTIVLCPGDSSSVLCLDDNNTVLCPSWHIVLLLSLALSALLLSPRNGTRLFLIKAQHHDAIATAQHFVAIPTKQLLNLVSRAQPPAAATGAQHRAVFTRSPRYNNVLPSR